MKQAVDRTLFHRITSVNKETKEGHCSICGPVVVKFKKILKNGNEQWICHNRKATYARKINCKYSSGLYEIKYKEQEGRCAICGDFDVMLVADHCHVQQVPRDLICTPCNLGLGMSLDSIKTLQAMQRYLARTFAVPIDRTIPLQRVRSAKSHKMSSINISTMTAMCSFCGLSKIRRNGVVNGIQRYRCDPNVRATTEDRKQLTLLYRFGITMDVFAQILELQKGVCAICQLPETKKFNGRTQALSIDHDHSYLGAKPKIRGLLCDKCNIALGQFHDDPLRIQSAILYLQRHQRHQTPPAPVPIQESTSMTLDQFVHANVDDLLVIAV